MATSVTIRRGDNSTLRVTIYQGTSSTTVADLTDSKLYFTLKERENHPDSRAVLSKNSEPGGGITINTPTNGIAEIELTASETRGLKTGTHWFDVQLKDSLEQVFTVLAGNVVVNADITIGTS